MKNHSLIDADGNTHVKIAAVALVASVVFMVVVSAAGRLRPHGRRLNSRPGREGADVHDDRGQRPSRPSAKPSLTIRTEGQALA